MDLDKAKQICYDMADMRARWGKHASFNPHSKADVLDALVVIAHEGLFDREDNHDDLVKANRQKGMAEARATKYKKEVDELKKELQELEKKENVEKSDTKKWFK